MNEIRHFDVEEDQSGDNTEQLKRLTLNGENEDLKPAKCTPTLDHLQVP